MRFVFTGFHTAEGFAPVLDAEVRGVRIKRGGFTKSLSWVRSQGSSCSRKETPCLFFRVFRRVVVGVRRRYEGVAVIPISL